jgi:hypothetical protein
MLGLRSLKILLVREHIREGVKGLPRAKTVEAEGIPDLIGSRSESRLGDGTRLGGSEGGCAGRKDSKDSKQEFGHDDDDDDDTDTGDYVSVFWSRSGDSSPLAMELP